MNMQIKCSFDLRLPTKKVILKVKLGFLIIFSIRHRNCLILFFPIYHAHIQLRLAAKYLFMSASLKVLLTNMTKIVLFEDRSSK